MVKHEAEAHVDLCRTPKVRIDISDTGDSLSLEYRPAEALLEDTQVSSEPTSRSEVKIVPRPDSKVEADSPYDELVDKRRLLRKALCHRFSLEELRDLCFDLHVEYDSLPGEGMAAKARELVAFFERRRELGRLVSAVRRERRDIF